MQVQTWGLRKVLFYVDNFGIESYSVFMILAILVGILIYIYQLEKDGVRSQNALFIVIFAVVGGTIGSKVPLIFMYWNEIIATRNPFAILMSGRTILGGLIGGAVGTFLAKKYFKINERMGNQIAIPVAVGMAVGRIGCLLAGCCFGKPTSLPWGIDFGDHIYRHPTQVYEMLFDLLLAGFLVMKKSRGVKPGELFTIFLNCYLSFRFLLEYIRVEKVSFVFFTDFQLICMISLIYINRNIIFKVFKRKVVEV